jgi:heterodisulfide reductase subunit A-like polyferredoxin/intein/homing endonuclease
LRRVGVVLCACGSAVGGRIDLVRVAEGCRASPLVRDVLISDQLCKPAGLGSLEEFLRTRELDCLVVGACSSALHEQAFRAEARSRGIPDSLVEVVDLRELCSMVHVDREAATGKALRLLSGAARRLSVSRADPAASYAVVKSALVVGGGIAGVQCALDIANAGYKVYLVEAEPSIGGVMAQLDKTIPTLDCSICMPGDEEVVLHDGTFVTLRELADKLLDDEGSDQLLTYSFDDYSIKAFKVIAAQKLPAPKKLVEVHTSTGAKIRFTPDHRIMVDTPVGPSWVKCEELKVGDRLYSPRKLSVQRPSEGRSRIRTLAHVGGGKARLGSQKLDENVMYLLGLISSGGCIEDQRIRFCNAEKSLVRLFIDNYKKAFPGRSTCLASLEDTKNSWKNRMVVQVENKILSGMSGKLGVKDDLKPIFRLDENLIAAFLRGFFDGGGHARLIKRAKWTTSKIEFTVGDNYELGYGLHLLLKRLGILSRVHKHDGRVVVDISEEVDVLEFVEKVGSNHPRGLARLKRIARGLKNQKARGGLFEEMPLECGGLISSLRRKYNIPLRVFPLSHSNFIRVARQERRVTREDLGRILDAIEDIVDPSDPDLLRLRKILSTEFFLDRVRDVQIVASTDNYVYDLTVDTAHCFVPKGAFVVSNCIEGPRLSEAGRNGNIVIIPNAEVRGVEGKVGDFKVRVEVKPTYVDPLKCNGCGACVEVCPVYQPNRYDVNLKPVKAIYSPFAQAVPLKYVINKDVCTECGLCQKACGLAAINLNDVPKELELRVGAIVIATGARLFDPKLKPQYHYGEYENVLTSIEFERVICASGPTGGELLLRDGRHPKRIAFVQCVGSRDKTVGMEDCSLFCCAVSMKQARLIKEHDPDAEVYVFYTDIRAQGKGWEDLYARVREDGVRFIRCRPSELRRNELNGTVVIPYEDSLTGERGELEVDMVVLALGMWPSDSTVKLARMMGLQTRGPGWIEEAQPKFRPLETFAEGVFVAGTCHGPRDISESVIEGSGAAGLVLSLFSRDELSEAPRRATVDAQRCTGCMRCREACEYGAIAEEGGRAVVNGNLCKGCGACVPACFQGAISLKGWHQEALAEQLKGLLEAT